VQWDAQPRDDRGVSWGEAVQRMRLPTAIGAIWLVGASMAGATPLHWALSLVPGLLLAMPASVWTSVASFGLLARRCGLFLTEDELAPSPILRAFNRALVRDAVPLAHTVPHQQFGYLHPTEGEAH
jgi:membrane glycosyltransferase